MIANGCSSCCWRRGRTCSDSSHGSTLDCCWSNHSGRVLGCTLEILDGCVGGRVNNAYHASWTVLSDRTVIPDWISGCDIDEEYSFLSHGYLRNEVEIVNLPRWHCQQLFLKRKGPWLRAGMDSRNLLVQHCGYRKSGIGAYMDFSKYPSAIYQDDLKNLSTYTSPTFAVTELGVNTRPPEPFSSILAA